MILAILSLVFSIIGLIIGAIPCGIAAIILSICAMIAVTKNSNDNRVPVYIIGGIALGVGIFDLIAGIVYIAILAAVL